MSARDRRNGVAPVLAAIALVVCAAPGGSAASLLPVAQDEILIAVLDSGIDAWHPEFRLDQVVAWKDFVRGRPDPYDDNGHGTATASLAAGLNRGSCGTVPKVSFAPGARLAIAKVLDGSAVGSYEHLSAGIRWAIEQDVDVVSISVAGGLPLTGGPLPADMTPAIEEARSAGILVVVAAGNGFLNAGVAPYPTWSAPFGNEPTALVVGGGTRQGAGVSTTGNTDPDITSWSDDVCVARFITGTYGLESGTSLAAPLVAGMAATLVETAREAGKPASPDAIEALLELSASNTVASPYAREGLGHVWTTQFEAARGHAANGTLFSDLVQGYDAQGPHAAPDRAYAGLVTELGKAQDQ